MFLFHLPKLYYMSKSTMANDCGSCYDKNKNKTEVQTRLFSGRVTWPLCLPAKSHGLL